MKVSSKIRVQWQKKSDLLGIDFVFEYSPRLTKMSLGSFVNNIDLNENRNVM